MRRKEERSKQDQTNNEAAKQHSTPKVVAFPKKNELPRVGFEPTTLHSRQSALPWSYQDCSAGWAQISHLIVHLMNRLTNSVCTCKCSWFFSVLFPYNVLLGLITISNTRSKIKGFTKIQPDSAHARNKICMHTNFMFIDISVIEVLLFKHLPDIISFQHLLHFDFDKSN